MSLNIIDARIVNKILTSGTPSQAPSSDHTDGTWFETDAYIAEVVLNTSNDKVFIMSQSGPLELAVTTGATSGVFIDGAGTINTIPKFTGSTEIGDSVVTETGGVVRINTAGNAATPAFTLIDTDSGLFRGATDSLSVSIEGAEIQKWSHATVDLMADVNVTGQIDIGIRVITGAIMVRNVGVTASGNITNQESFVRATPSGSNINLLIPSPAGSTPTPIDGQILTIFKEGDAAGNLSISTNIVGGIIEPLSTISRDRIRIAGGTASPNVSVTLQYIDDLGKWITVSSNSIESLIYETTI